MVPLGFHFIVSSVAQLLYSSRWRYACPHITICCDHMLQIFKSYDNVIIEMNATVPYWWSVNIGSGNGLVPSGNKTLPEPVLTKISDAIWRY